MIKPFTRSRQRSARPGSAPGRSLLAAGCGALATLLAARAASADPPNIFSKRADDLQSLLDAPAPPTLPALAHRDLTMTFEYTAAVIQPKSNDRSGDAFAYFAHIDAEYPIVPRTWFAGLSNDIASAAVPGVGTAFLLGNPELSGRGLWSSTRGLSSGGGLGIVLPVPRVLSPLEEEVLRTVRTVRPWDLASFSSLTLTFRPWIDIRHVVGGLVFQLRQGIDWSINLNGPDKPPGGVTSSGSSPRLTNFTARLTFYMGYRLLKQLGVGVEVWEVYEVTKDLKDDNRASFTLSPSIRLMLWRVQPALSLLFPVATPLRGDVASYYAGRISLNFNFDVRPGKSDITSKLGVEQGL